MRAFFAVLTFVFLVSCGGGRVSGVVAEACMDAGRSAANARTCSCVQNAANQTLRGSDQAKAASFFADPNEAQAARQAGGSFWTRYRHFTDMAEAMCKA